MNLLSHVRHQQSDEVKMKKSWVVNSILAFIPSSTQEAAQQVPSAQIEKADLQKVVNTSSNTLNLHNQNMLLELLKKYEEVCYGMLCDWKAEPISFELLEGAKPDHVCVWGGDFMEI